jgi:hypothetical protein
MPKHIRIINIHQVCIVKHAANTSYLRGNINQLNTTIIIQNTTPHTTSYTSSHK